MQRTLNKNCKIANKSTNVTKSRRNLKQATKMIQTKSEDKKTSPPPHTKHIYEK